MRAAIGLTDICGPVSESTTVVDDDPSPEVPEATPEKFKNYNLY